MFNWFKRDRGPTPPAAFPYPLEIVHGSEALAAFDRLKREGKGSPVIIGGEAMLTRTIEHLEFTKKSKRSVEDILRDAANNPFPQALRAEQAAEVARFQKEEPDWIEEDPPMGEWPTEALTTPMPGPGLAHDIRTRALHDKLHIALIPTRDATEIPAYLNWGGWNACPKPHHHVAAARYWRDKYGAELVSMGSDVVEFRVARRPQTRDEAMTLAREHSDYNSEIEELLPYAAELMVSDWWYFWWD